MRVCHGFTAVFDDPNLVSCAGLAPVLHLAERAGLQRLVGEHVELGKAGGVNAHLKIPALVVGMVAGADSIDDMALLRHGAMRRLFAGVRAPSTLGTFLRSFTFGHVRQLDAVASRLLVNLAGEAPLLPGADELAYVDADDTLRRTYGYAKQGAGCGYTGVKGLNALLAIVSTPSAALVHRESARIRALGAVRRRRARCGAAGGGAGGASAEQLRGRDGVGQCDGRARTGGRGLRPGGAVGVAAGPSGGAAVRDQRQPDRGGAQLNWPGDAGVAVDDDRRRGTDAGPPRRGRGVVGAPSSRQSSCGSQHEIQDTP